MQADRSAPAAPRASQIDLTAFASPIGLTLEDSAWVGHEDHGGDHDAVQDPIDAYLWATPEDEYWLAVAFGGEPEVDDEEADLRMGRGYSEFRRARGA